VGTRPSLVLMADQDGRPVPAVGVISPEMHCDPARADHTRTALPPDASGRSLRPLRRCGAMSAQHGAAMARVLPMRTCGHLYRGAETMPDPKEPPSSEVQAGGRPSGHLEADDSEPEDQRRDAADVDNE